MKIVLINPASQEKVYGKIHKHLPPTAPSLGVLYLAAVLEENKIPVYVIDAYGENYNLERTVEEIKRLKPDIVGYTVMTTVLGVVVELARRVKEDLPCSLNIVGGPHITAMPVESLINYPFLDISVIGEGEYTLLEIAQGRNLNEIKGIAYRQKDGEVVLNPPREGFIDVDKLPLPAKHLIDLAKYHHALFESYGKPLTTLLTSRGCPYQCTFCSSQVTFGRRIRFRNVESVMAEVDSLIEKYRIKAIEFRDDVFTVNKARVIKLSEELGKRKIAWIANARLDIIDDDMVKAMKEGGCKLLEVGVESGSQKILDEYRKGIKIEQILKAFEIFNRYKIDTLAFFIFGALSETAKTAQKTIDLAKKIKPTFVEFFILNPMPGSPAYKTALEKGMMKSIDWTEVSSPQFFKPIIKHPNFSEEELVGLIKRAYKEFYLRFSYILKIALRMNSPLRIRTYVRLLPAILKLSGVE